MTEDRIAMIIARWRGGPAPFSGYLSLDYESLSDLVEEAIVDEFAAAKRAARDDIVEF